MSMAIRPEDLPSDPARLIEMALSLDAENDRLRAVIDTFKDMVFGSRSEKLAAVVADQLALDLADLATDVTLPAAANDDHVPSQPAGAIGKPRKKAQRNIGALPKHLSRCEQVIEPATTACPCCQSRLHKIGQDISEVLDVIPAILRVLRIQAKALPRLIENSMASTALVTHVVVSKFAWFSTLYRQVQILAGHGIRLDRSTLAGWVKRTAWWLKGLYELQLRTIHAAPLFFCDETRMPVLDPGRGRTKICQFWAHAVDDRPWSGPSPPAVAYVFADGRGKGEIAAQLVDYAILQVDGYVAYKSLAKDAREAGTIRLAFCLAHARRKFVAVYKTTKSPFAQEVIERIAAIYAIEERVRGTTAGIRLAARKAESKPLMEELKTRLTEVLKDISAKSPLAEAINYTLGHWEGLTVFLTDGRVEVDTNTVERSMRPIALGRKNSLFSGSEGGAESWAILASLLNTAKLNGLDPQTYLCDVLERIESGHTKNHKHHDLHDCHWYSHTHDTHCA